MVYARHGRNVMGCKSPVRFWESQGDQGYQMTAPIDKVLDEGNCGRAIDRGEEARGCVVKPTNVNVVGHIHVKAARLRTETSYKAGSARRASTTSRSRSQILDLVNDELGVGSSTGSDEVGSSTGSDAGIGFQPSHNPESRV